MHKRPSSWLVGLLVLLVLDWILVLAYQPSSQPRITVPYSYFTQQIQANNVGSVTAQASTIQGTFRHAITDPAQSGSSSTGQKPTTTTLFTTTRPTFADDHLLTALTNEGATVTAKPISN
ncbi:MAG: ATP-dependent metallopeptidase FtsH/Yme1/Tma family protein, partial [Solirubrobacteraceae bacterium]